MPCDLSEIDPFEKVYDALWALVERNPYFVGQVAPPITAALKTGNKIKFNKENSYKVNIANGDTPELQLIIGPLSHFTTNCGSCGISKTYIWGLATGDSRRTLHNKISFELFRSMIDYEATLCALTWCSCNFVLSSQIVAEDVGRQMNDLNREVNGWSSLLSIEVKFIFPSLKLKVL